MYERAIVNLKISLLLLLNLEVVGSRVGSQREGEVCVGHCAVTYQEQSTHVTLVLVLDHS